MSTHSLKLAAGQTLSTLARDLRVYDWPALAALLDGKKPVTELRPGDEVQVPGDGALDDAKKKLGDAGRDAAAYFGGRSYLSPLESIAVSVKSDVGAALADGTPWALTDDLGNVLVKGTIEDGAIATDVPRRAYRLNVDGLDLGELAPVMAARMPTPLSGPR